MVNQERRKAKLRPLVWDERLAALARAHSLDMQKQNYFAHEAPDGETLADRAARSGLTYTRLGENLAFAHDLQAAHRGLMKSPGHRANILRPEFRRLGVGIIRLPANTRYHPQVEGQSLPPAKLGGYLLVTQVFAS
ncbi:CAP domain-containing protein [bacterium]|nr:CAP domain-containing protein [bacterium]